MLLQNILLSIETDTEAMPLFTTVNTEETVLLLNLLLDILTIVPSKEAVEIETRGVLMDLMFCTVTPAMLMLHSC